MVKAIETEYAGYKFRSRLEARWAVFFDEAGIEWEYEPEGFKLSDGTKYLPDFYLPESDSFFEVKGIMTVKDDHKISQFIKEFEKSVTIGYDKMEFEACDLNYGFCRDSGKSDSVLAKCHKCGKLWFMGTMGSWKCQCCGFYDGDAGFDVMTQGDGTTWIDRKKVKYKPITKAKQARFEYGETPKR